MCSERIPRLHAWGDSQMKGIEAVDSLLEKLAQQKLFEKKLRSHIKGIN
jgi:hypothetical protein